MDRLYIAFVSLVLVSGCTILFDPDRVTYVGDAGPRDAGARTDAGDRDGGGMIDTGPGFDAGMAACGQIGEACCSAPSPACVPGANCTFDGCQPCGQPGQECCDDNPECAVLSCVDATGRCPVVTALVQVTVPAGGTYGIDAHEVTRQQYEDWLATSPVATGFLVGPGCGGNTTFTPDATCLAAGFDCTGVGCGLRPQTCIDWCDAFAYCAAVGKQLCGGYTDGSELSMSSFADATRSAWYNACSSGGMFTYATGDDGGFASDNCQWLDLGGSADAPSLTNCQSPAAGYMGVLAMTGNVREWVNSCDGLDDPTSNCIAVGGAFADNDFFEGQCNFPNTHVRTSFNAGTGFRCCEVP
jgi:sulfatase modifying factor 1